MNREQLAEKIKRSFDIADESQDAVILDLIEDAEKHFRLITGAEEVHDDYDFIIKEVVSVRYNRLSSHGIRSEKVGDYTATYSKPEEDFLPYIELLDRRYNFLGRYQKGKVMFV